MFSFENWIKATEYIGLSYLGGGISQRTIGPMSSNILASCTARIPKGTFVMKSVLLADELLDI